MTFFPAIFAEAKNPLQSSVSYVPPEIMMLSVMDKSRVCEANHWKMVPFSVFVRLKTEARGSELSFPTFI